MKELNKIYNEDCFEGMKQIPDNSINLIVTDPPYELHYGGGGSINKVKKLKSSLKQLETADIISGYDIATFANEVQRLQGKNINAYFWCNKKQIPEYFNVYVNGLNCKFDILCWHKKNALPTYSNKYLSDTEYCLHFYKGKGQTHPECYEDAKTYDVSIINYQDKKKYYHPTIKPLYWMEKIIKNSSIEGDIILDPFMGSGTTAVACLKNNRKFIGFEINQEFYNTSLNRIENYDKEDLPSTC